MNPVLRRSTLALLASSLLLTIGRGATLPFMTIYLNRQYGLGVDLIGYALTSALTIGVVFLAQEVLAQWGITASSAALPTERLNHYSLCMERYEDERPDAQSACRVGDIRVLQREKS
ncbi:hypothetical protein HA863_000468 [Salmonella enterica]|nr:hypothetical protein [Salmonella enterica]